MATLSITKNISIKKRNVSRSLVSALENAEKKSGEEVKLQRACREAKGDMIKKLFGEEK